MATESVLSVLQLFGPEKPNTHCWGDPPAKVAQWADMFGGRSGPPDSYACGKQTASDFGLCDNCYRSMIEGR